MDGDLVLTIGLALVVLSVPGVFGAVVEGRMPRLPALIGLVGLACVVGAIVARPGGYAIDEVPGIVRAVIERYV